MEKILLIGVILNPIRPDVPFYNTYSVMLGDKSRSMATNPPTCMHSPFARQYCHSAHQEVVSLSLPP